MVGVAYIPAPPVPAAGFDPSVAPGPRSNEEPFWPIGIARLPPSRRTLPQATGPSPYRVPGCWREPWEPWEGRRYTLRRYLQLMLLDFGTHNTFPLAWYANKISFLAWFLDARGTVMVVCRWRRLLGRLWVTVFSLAALVQRTASTDEGHTYVRAVPRASFPLLFRHFPPCAPAYHAHQLSTPVSPSVPSVGSIRLGPSKLGPSQWLRSPSSTPILWRGIKCCGLSHISLLELMFATNPIASRVPGGRGSAVQPRAAGPGPAARGPGRRPSLPPGVRVYGDHGLGGRGHPGLRLARHEVRQLRHDFDMTFGPFLTPCWPFTSPRAGVCSALLRDHGYWTLIDACNPMLICCCVKIGASDTAGAAPMSSGMF